MRTINEIIIHCSATRPDWMEGNTPAEQVDEIRRWHKEDNGWSDIAYHYVIARNGTIVPGRHVERQGAHTKGHNAESVGICLIGGYKANATDDFEDHFTKEQEQSLRKLINSLKFQYTGIRKVSGHNRYAARGCPGFQADSWNETRPVDAELVRKIQKGSTPMKGKRTFLMAFLAGLPALMDSSGVMEVIPPSAYPFYTAGVAALMAYMRTQTDTAPLHKE